MAKSVMILDTYYVDALEQLNADTRLDASSIYGVENERVTSFGFGTGGSYARALSEYSWDASVVVPNSLGLQDLWAQEHHVQRPVSIGWKRLQVLTRPPIMRDVLRWLPHAHSVLLQQVKAHRPDVLLVQDINAVPPSLVRQFKKYAGVVIGEIASPLPPSAFVTCYDRIISALPTIVEYVQSKGVPSSYLPLGFDSRWRNSTESHQRQIDVVFVGSFSRLQPNTAPLLRAIAAAVPTFRLYGNAKPSVLEEAGLTAHYYGPVWGREMFAVLGNSKIVINRHGTVAGNYAVNMRMYEATGSGAALVTEDKSNLSDLFEIGKEVLSYSDVSNAVRTTTDLLSDSDRLAEIASAGHQRTMRDHTYGQRAAVLVQIFEEDLKRLHRK
jgi:hypothetical protein